MKLTIITSAFNVQNEIQITINSLRSQTNKNFQWIVIDGGSVDASVKTYIDNPDLIDFWISEVDSGIYEAWNKAIKHIKGDWTLFLGAGDSLPTSHLIDDLIHELETQPKTMDFICGDVCFFGRDSNLLLNGNVNLNDWDLGLPKLPPHPGVLHNSRLFKKYSFDQTYKIAADSKFMLEHLNKYNSAYINLVITNMSFGGISSRPESWGKISQEKMRIRKELGLAPPSMLYAILDWKLFIKPLLFLVLGHNLSRIMIYLRHFKL